MNADQQQVLFQLVQGPQGMAMQSPLDPRALLRLLSQVIEDVREAALKKSLEGDSKLVQVIPAGTVKLQ